MAGIMTTHGPVQYTRKDKRAMRKAFRNDGRSHKDVLANFKRCEANGSPELRHLWTYLINKLQ